MAQDFQIKTREVVIGDTVWLNPTAGFVWDSNTLSWVKATQSAAGAAGLTDTQLRATPVPVSGPLTDTQLRATSVPVSGTFFQATQPVSGTFFQGIQPVSGPLTDTQLRATPVPVSGTVSVGTVPVTGPLTDTQMRATPVPVSGTVSVGTVPVTQSGTWAVSLPTNAAQETGGNLATLVSNDFSTSAKQDALLAKMPTLTSLGSVPVDMEADIRVLNGVSELYVADAVMRRLAEQSQLNDYAAGMQAILNTECETSHRMGVELR